MRDETCPTRLNRPFSREKPKPQMEYMSTSNCSLHKNDLISVTLATFSLLPVVTLNDGGWKSCPVNNLKLAYVRFLVISGFGFSQSFSTLEKVGFDSDPRLHDLWPSCSWASHFLLSGCPSGKANQKRVAASSLQEKDNTADGSGFPSPLSPHCC